MPRQLEGSRAVAETVALCRPEVICAYPISPQTHIVENLSQLVKAGELAPCEFVNVESEFAAMSVAIGASRDRRARLHGDRQPGPAVHGRGALQRLRARPADRDDGRQPRDRRADQHLERPHRLDVPARLAAGSSSTPRPTRRRSTSTSRPSGWPRSSRTPVMVCMDGFILTHAVERVEMPTQEQVDAFLPPFEPRQVLDPDEPVTIGAMVGPEAFMEVKYLAHAKQMQALELIPEIAERLRAAPSAATPAACCAATAPRTPRRSSWRSARCSARSRTPSMSCASEGVKIGVVGDQVVPPVPAGGGARARSGTRSAWSCSRRRSRSASAGSSRANVRMALAGIQLHGYTVIAGLGGRPITKASLRGLFDGRRRRAPRAADVPRPGLGRREPRAPAHARLAHLRAARREHPARRRTRRGGPGMRSARA